MDLKNFGEEASKPLLIDFLNALLPQTNKIIDLNFKNTEHLEQTDAEHKVLLDAINNPKLRLAE